MSNKKRKKKKKVKRKVRNPEHIRMMEIGRAIIRRNNE